MKENQIIIYQGTRSKWQIFIASVLFSISILVIISFFVKIKMAYFEYLYYAHWMGKVFLLAYILPTAINHSSNYIYSFDFENKRYKKQFSVGPLRYGKWRKLRHIEYVSIFKQPINNGAAYIFDINIWLKNKKHLTISRYSDLYFENAFEMGFQIAKTLEISFLDSTAEHSKEWNWVELDQNLDSLIEKHPKHHV